MPPIVTKIPRNCKMLIDSRKNRDPAITTINIEPPFTKGVKIETSPPFLKIVKANTSNAAMAIPAKRSYS